MLPASLLVRSLGGALLAGHRQVGESTFVFDPRDPLGAGLEIELERPLHRDLAEAKVRGRVDTADDNLALLAVLDDLVGRAVLEVGQQPQDVLLSIERDLTTLVTQALAQRDPERGGINELTSFIWGVADLIRDTFKRGKYQDVILPLTVLRRLDCVLAPTRGQVLAVQAKYRGRIENLDPQLRRASGFAFYNTSRYDFEKLLADAPHIAQNLRNWIAGFSPNMREVVEKFDFDNTIAKLDEAGLPSADEWRWRLKSGNHELIADGGEGYRSKYSCEHGIDLVRSTDHDTPVKELEEDE